MNRAAEDNFIVTHEYRRFTEFCDACRRYHYIGLCYGPPGVGKTLSARYYANWERVEGFDLYDDAMTGMLAAVLPCETLFYTSSLPISLRRVEQFPCLGNIMETLYSAPQGLHAGFAITLACQKSA